MSSITIAGLGIKPARHATVEVLECLRASDWVFHSVAAESTREWIRSVAAVEEDLNLTYRDGLPRIEAYRAMAERVVTSARKGADVAFIVYGHPCVLHTGVQLALQSAAQYSLNTRVLPAVSSIDGLLAAIRVDPGVGGLHVLEVSDMLLYSRIPQRESHVVLLQVASTGSRLHVGSGHKGERVDFLLRRLATFYSPDHRALHFRLQTTDGDDSLRWTNVEKLYLEKWSDASSLYLPPVRTRESDAVYVGLARKFGWSGF